MPWELYTDLSLYMHAHLAFQSKRGCTEDAEPEACLTKRRQKSDVCLEVRCIEHLQSVYFEKTSKIQSGVYGKTEYMLFI